MLTDDEYNELDELAYSSAMAFTTVAALGAVPEVTQLILRTTSQFDGLIGFGSKIGDKYGKHISLRFPPALLEDNNSPNKQKKLTGVVTLNASGLLGSSYELLKKYEIKEDPVWEFFFHVRNAAFHGNKFYFSKSTQKRWNAGGEKGRWRGLNIIPALEGTPLFYDFLGVGDVFMLLGDITHLIGLPIGRGPIFWQVDPSWFL